MDILILIISFLLGLLPSIALYKWLRKKNKDEKYKVICKNAFVRGILAVFPIMLTSGLLYIIGRLSGLWKINTLLYQAYYTFIVLAFAEELIKFLTFRSILKKNSYEYSWFNVTIFMIIIGLGFGCIENVTIAVGSNIITMLIRGISIGHAGYGFVMGWFYGKMLKTGKKVYGLLGFLIPWFLHGLYDFGLRKELIDVNDNFAFISILLELVCIFSVILIVRFIRKRRDSDIYTEPFKELNKID